MEELHLNNVPTLTISEIVNMLSESFISYIESGIKFKEFPSIMLWGALGVGKSQSVRQIAKNIQDKTGKVVNIVDVRLLLFNPIDFRCIYEFIKNNVRDIEFKAIVVLTDGWGEFPYIWETMDIPTIWVVTEKVKPPFGKIVKYNKV